MSNFTTHNSKIRTLRPGNKNFHIIDGMVTAPRAGLEISNRCPENYKSLIVECINHGWLKPVANITEREMIFMGLTNET
jgi:hypothetical protein